MSAAISLAPLYLFGIGLLAAGPARRALVTLPADHRVADGCASVAGLWMLGILANQLLVLVLHSLTLALALGASLAVAGLVLGAVAFTRARAGESAADRDGALWIGVAGALLATIVALYAVLILTLPLTHWDARSIWFFHAKILHFAGALANDPAWAEIDFAHADYPKAIAILAAQITTLAGYWNEYLPKAALLVLLIPAALGYAAFCERPLSALFLIVMVFFPAWRELWNGYADGYLALYAGLGVLALGRWLDRRQTGDLLLGLAALGIVASLKNEGAFIVACAAIGGAFAYSARSASKPPVARAAVVWIAAIAFAGPVAWAFTKLGWGLRSDLRISFEMFATAWGRLLDPEAVGRIATTLFPAHEFAAAIVPLALAFAAAKWLRIRSSAQNRLAVTTACLYLAVLFGAYLGTPHELGWHLETSASRTVLPVLVLFSAATFQLLAAIERAPAAARTEHAG